MQVGSRAGRDSVLWHVELRAGIPVAAALVSEYGISVFARNAVDTKGYYEHINSALDGQPDFVFDDGCDLVNTVHATRSELLGTVKAGCEETTTGVIRLRAMAADQQMIIAADTLGKYKMLCLVIASVLLILNLPALYLPGMIVLSAGLLLSVVSGIDYLRKYLTKIL